MFDFPLSIPRDTLYEDLGLTPEATADEVRNAIKDREQELLAKQAEIGALLESIYLAVPGLKEAKSELSTLRLVDANLKDRESQIRAARDNLNELERQALAINPEFRHLRKQLEDLKRQGDSLNNLPLSTPAKRLDYDREHPPLELLKLASYNKDTLFDRNLNSIALTTVRRELSNFLYEQGEEVFHPSDLTREDFSADFNHTPLLDGDEQ
jgi:hypothetical protein